MFGVVFDMRGAENDCGYVRIDSRNAGWK